MQLGARLPTGKLGIATVVIVILKGRQIQPDAILVWIEEPYHAIHPRYQVFDTFPVPIGD